jgi:MFS family permease
MSDSDGPIVSEKAAGYGWRFWAIISSLTVTSLLAALDLSIISTALPSIVEDLGSGTDFVWVANAYYLTTTAFQPLYGQISSIFGRRLVTLSAVVLFAIGSAVAGSAPTMGALIAGRAIQGVGGGGITVMVQIIIGDLVPLRERAKFTSIVFIAYAVGIALGPVVGGLLTDRVTWRWIFYINLPIAGVSLVLLFLFLRVRNTDTPIAAGLKRIDFGGNALLVASMVAILLALTWGGTEHPWVSAETLVPLILGLLGLGVFAWLQSTSYHPEPTMPGRLFANRTSLSAFGLTFVHSVLMNWISYYLPLYFQSCLGATPTLSGVYFLPTAIAAMPFAIGAGIFLSKVGRYRPMHFAGVALLFISFGLFSRLDENSSTGYWLGVQFIEAGGVGFLLPATLPAVQAPLEESDMAVSTAAWAFVRSFGSIWGVAIPTAIFNSKVNELVVRISVPELRTALVNGGAFAKASKTFINSLNDTPKVKLEVLSVYVDSLKLTWQIGLAFCGVAFIFAMLIKEIAMRTTLESEPGVAHEQILEKDAVIDTEANVPDKRKTNTE